MSLPLNWVWTHKRVRTLKRMYSEGHDDNAIAEELGLTPCAVRVKRNKLKPLKDILAGYTTGQLMHALELRGYHIQIKKKP